MTRHLLVFACFFSIACGDGGSAPAGDAGAAACTDGQLCMTLSVPADFAGAPRELFVGLYASLPPAGPPDVMVGRVAMPDVAPGMPARVVLDGVEDVGDYHVFVALYVEGGGMFTPEPGLDYQAWTDARRFGEGPVDLGVVAVELAE